MNEAQKLKNQVDWKSLSLKSLMYNGMAACWLQMSQSSSGVCVSACMCVLTYTTKLYYLIRNFFISSAWTFSNFW